MKVVEFITELNKIGFNDKTELMFGCINGETKNWHLLKPDTQMGIKSAFSYGEDLTKESYRTNIINFNLDVDSCTGYLNEKLADGKIVTSALSYILSKHKNV